MAEENTEDTQLSKDIERLEYRPNFKKDAEKIRSGYYNEKTDIEDLIQIAPDPPEVGDGVLTNDVGKLVQIKEDVEKLIENLEKDLKKFKVSLEDESYKESLDKSKHLLGLSEGTDITISDYEKALDNLDRPAGAFIVELFEQSVEDIDGNLKAELLGDIIEIRNETTNMLNFVDKFVGNPLLSSDIDYSDEHWQDKLLTAEKEQKEYRLSVEEKEAKINDEYKNAMLFDSSKLLSAKQSKLDNYKIVKDVTYQTNSLNDAHYILHQKTNEMNYLINHISNNLERTPLKEEGNLWEPLLSITNDEKDAKEALTNIEVMLKLSLDSSNNEKHMMKNRLRNLYDVKQREKILNELSVSNQAFSSGVTDLQARLMHFDNYQNEEMEILLDGVADGLESFSKERNDKMKEFYNISLGESDLREEKIDNVLKKDNARQGYQLMTKFNKIIDARLGMQE